MPLKLPQDKPVLELLLVLLLGSHALAMCPSMCSCSHSHREVDCSWRGLRHFPDGLQHNVLSLNLSHNHLHDLDGQLTVYTHLRFLDLSHNRLSHLPTGLPRSLWHLYASSNCLRLLDKNDTVFQWNLRVLDLSSNKLGRAIFINNTLINLCRLNLSHNHLWTLPTNLPAHLKTIDLSHNLLVKVLPGSLDRLLRLSHFYLNANRFSMLPFGALDKLTSLSVINLDNNPWACHLYDHISYLLSWTQRTPARVLGCPCHIQPVCGGVHPGKTGGWHFVSHNLHPLTGSPQDLSSVTPEASVTQWRYLSVPSWLSPPHISKETWNTPHHPYSATPISISSPPPRTTGTHLTVNLLSKSASPAATEHIYHTGPHLISGTFSDTSLVSQAAQFPTTESTSAQTTKANILRTRSVRKQNQSIPISSSPTSSWFPLLHKLGFLSLILQRVL